MKKRHSNFQDIKIGMATIIYDNYSDYPAWVLPGGERTTNKNIAIRQAEKINKIITNAA